MTDREWRAIELQKRREELERADNNDDHRGGKPALIFPLEFLSGLIVQP